MAGAESNYLIRPYRPSDGLQLRKFKCETLRQNYTRPPEKWLRDAPVFLDTAAAVNPFIFVAEDEQERIIGAALAGTPSNLPWIFSLGVVLDRRREHIGIGLKRRLLREFAERAGTTQLVSSSVSTRNVPMLELNAQLLATRRQDPDDDKYLLSTVLAEPVVEEPEG